MIATTNLIRLISLSIVLFCAPPKLSAAGGAEGAPEKGPPPEQNEEANPRYHAPHLTLSDRQLDSVHAGQGNMTYNSVILPHPSDYPWGGG